MSAYFEPHAVLVINKPRFDSVEEIVALSLLSLGTLTNAINAALYIRNICTQPRTAFLVLMVTTSVCMTMAEICAIVGTHILLIPAVRALYGWSIGLGTLCFALGQAQAINIFLKRVTPTEKLMRTLTVTHLIVHVVTITPIYTYGIAFMYASDKGLLAYWYNLTSGLWWAWSAISDVSLCLYIGWHIGKLGKTMVEVRVGSSAGSTDATAAQPKPRATAGLDDPDRLSVVADMPHDRPSTHTAQGDRTAAVLPDSSSGQQLSSLSNDAVPDTAEQIPAASGSRLDVVSPRRLPSLKPSNGQCSSMAPTTGITATAVASAASPQPPIPSHPPGARLPSQRPIQISMSMTSMLRNKDGKTKAVKRVTLMERYRSKFIRTISLVVLLATIDILGVGLYALASNMVDVPGSRNNRRAIAVTQICSAIAALHTSFAFLFYTTLAQLFSLARTGATSIEDATGTQSVVQGQ
ncbi:hypothetical protein BC831DRAFT_456232 [Entophlyctis helioformis]|nr:hypothetical protein BC831DRAFT_456232 [Entophlyctis helioformis]